jgi:hypothetical protein
MAFGDTESVSLGDGAGFFVGGAACGSTGAATRFFEQPEVQINAPGKTNIRISKLRFVLFMSIPL